MQSKTERRICGTCEYWTGLRNPIFASNGEPKVNIEDKEGCCEYYSSHFYEQSRQYDRNCKKYSKWTELL